jgi:hypothetical protein
MAYPEVAGVGMPEWAPPVYVLLQATDLAACPGGLSAKVLLVIMALIQGLNTIRFKALPEKSF